MARADARYTGAMFRLRPRRRRLSPSEIIVLPLDDSLAKTAQQIADFARVHCGDGHRLTRLQRTDGKGQLIQCGCGRPVPARSRRDALVALAEDENIDDNGD